MNAVQYYDAPAAPPIPKALQVGPDSLLSALAHCRRNHAAVHVRAKAEVERRAFAKQIRQMEQAELKKSKASKKADKAKQKMEKYRGKSKGKSALEVATERFIANGGIPKIPR